MFKYFLAAATVLLLWAESTPSMAEEAVNVTANRPGCHGGAEVWNGDTFVGCDFSGGGSGGGYGGRDPIGGIGGGGIAINRGDATTQRSAYQGTRCDQTGAPVELGDPVVLATGNEVSPETDFAGAGDMALSLTRTYNYYWNGIGIFGRRWLSDYDFKLLFTTDDPTSPCYPRPGNSTCDPAGKPIWAQRPDGRKIKFNYAASPAPGWYEDKASPIAKILKSGSTYVLYSEDRTVEVYDAAGFPSSIKNQQGIGWTFQYDGSHYLTRVTHTSGRHVDFTWVNGLLTRVTDPAGDSYQYTYKTLSVSASSAVRAQPATTGMRPMMLPPLDPGQDDPPPAPPTPPIQSMVALLIGTIQPGIMPTRIVYHYEDSRFQTALTGKTINDARFSWISYNADGRAIETKLAGGVERYQFAYTLDTGGNISITGVTNPLGKVTDYAFDIKGNQLSISEKASAHCAAAAKNRQYDSNGYLSSSTDFLGRVTNYTFNAKGQLLQLVENANADPAQRRTTSYAWDDYNRVVKETLAGDHETTYVYGGDNRLALVTVKNLSDKVPASAGQVRTTTYTYATWPNGLVSSMTIDGPLPGNGDALVATYSQTGDLLSTRNSFGQTTTYGNYNGLGLPGDITGPNGDKHAFIYDARGRVIDEQTFRNGSTQHTYYEYDAFGRLAKETRPDGQYHGYQYDGAGRLVSEYEPEAGGTFAQTVYAYNAMSLPVSVKKQRAFVEPPRGTVP